MGKTMFINDAHNVPIEELKQQAIEEMTRRINAEFEEFILNARRREGIMRFDLTIKYMRFREDELKAMQHD